MLAWKRVQLEMVVRCFPVGQMQKSPTSLQFRHAPTYKRTWRTLRAPKGRDREKMGVSTYEKRRNHGEIAVFLRKMKNKISPSSSFGCVPIHKTPRELCERSKGTNEKNLGNLIERQKQSRKYRFSHRNSDLLHMA